MVNSIHFLFIICSFYNEKKKKNLEERQALIVASLRKFKCECFFGVEFVC